GEAHANQFYDVGEGVAGVTITVKQGSAVIATTTTDAAGAYVLNLPPGDYTVTASGAGIGNPDPKTATIRAVPPDPNDPSAPTAQNAAASFAIPNNAGQGSRPAPTLLGVTDATAGTPPRFTWTGSPAAVRYELVLT